MLSAFSGYKTKYCWQFEQPRGLERHPQGVQKIFFSLSLLDTTQGYRRADSAMNFHHKLTLVRFSRIPCAGSKWDLKSRV